MTLADFASGLEVKTYCLPGGLSLSYLVAACDFVPACVILISVFLVPWFIRTRDKDTKFRKRIWSDFGRRMKRYDRDEE